MNIYEHELYKNIHLCSKYSDFLLKMVNFIENDKKLYNFLSFINKEAFMSSKEISKSFKSKNIECDKKYYCKEWDIFLNKYSFKQDCNLFFHDIVGHIILKNNVTSKGEILATAGMCGFSFELGKFWFVNAILIFSLGYRLFDGTRSDTFDISNIIEDINIAYQNGEKLRQFLDFDESLLKNISIEEYLFQNCDKLKEFKLEQFCVKVSRNKL